MLDIIRWMNSIWPYKEIEKWKNLSKFLAVARLWRSWLLKNPVILREWHPFLILATLYPEQWVRMDTVCYSSSPSLSQPLSCNLLTISPFSSSHVYVYTGMFAFVGVHVDVCSTDAGDHPSVLFSLFTETWSLNQTQSLLISLTSIGSLLWRSCLCLPRMEL